MMDGFIGWLRSIDRRWLYLLIFLSMFIPLTWPLGLPVGVSTWTRAVYDEIEKLKPGDRVLYAMDVGVTSAADELPQALAVLEHLMRNKIRIVFVDFVATGVKYSTDAVAPYEKAGKKYGEDFCHLGYVAGLESGMVAFFADMLATAPTDLRGNRTASLPIMDGVKTLRDVKMVIANVGGTPGVAEWVRQAYGPYKQIICVNALGPHFGLIEPYIQSKQVAGVLAGSRGGAEYEAILKKPGLGAAMMDSQSFCMLALLLVMVAGNAVYLHDRRKGGR
jgi:hypothetical protein